MNEEKCGCRVTLIEHLPDEFEKRINFCPTHAAAFEMMKALQNAVRTMRTYGTANMGFAIDEIDQALALCREKKEEAPDGDN